MFNFDNIYVRKITSRIVAEISVAYKNTIHAQLSRYSFHSKCPDLTYFAKHQLLATQIQPYVPLNLKYSYMEILVL